MPFVGKNTAFVRNIPDLVDKIFYAGQITGFLQKNSGDEEGFLCGFFVCIAAVVFVFEKQTGNKLPALDSPVYGGWHKYRVGKRGLPFRQ